MKRLQEIERRKEERKRRKEELLRLKKERELIALKNYIQNELINNMELNDDPSDICDFSNFHIKGKRGGNYLKFFIFYLFKFLVPMIGTLPLQIAFMCAYINKFYHEYVNEERLSKIMDSFIPKSSPFIVCLRKQDFDYFKELGAELESIEDITKVDEFIWVKNFLFLFKY